MSASILFEWHYLVFLLPLGVSVLLLVLSLLRLGHRGGHSRHGGVRHTGSSTSRMGPSGVRTAHHHGSAGAKPVHSAGKPAHTGIRSQGTKGKISEVSHPQSPLLTLLGIGRAPLPMIVQMFALCWGVVGILTNQMLLPHTPSPTLLQMLPSLTAALVGGLVGGRLSAEIIGRLMPREESSAVSRDALYGLSGRVVFPVDTRNGRVHIYDEHNTLHDERCRVVAGHAPIGKGRSVLVVDRDRNGILLVEELA
jgi:hypothetical protein